MTMPACKKQVYATMCETEDGRRTGKYRGNRYESHRKKTATKSTKTKTVRKTPATMKKVKAPKIVYDPDMAYDMAADRRLDDLEAQGFMVNRNRLNYGRKDPEELRLQTMHLQDAWMKRQASKRKKYTKTVTTLSNPIIMRDPHSGKLVKVKTSGGYDRYLKMGYVYFMDETPKTKDKKRLPITKYKVFFMKHDTDFGRYVKKKAHSLDELRGSIIANTIGQSYDKAAWVYTEDNKYVGRMRYDGNKNRYQWTSKDAWTDMKDLNKDGTEVKA